MTSFSLDPSAVDRLRARVGGSRPADAATGPPASTTKATAGDPSTTDEPVDGWFDGDDWSTKARSFGRRLVAPAERRFRAEVERAVEQRDDDLQRQVEELRGELIRTRTAHDAELAALNEQLRGRS
jgi:hypothetical protein